MSNLGRGQPSVDQIPGAQDGVVAASTICLRVTDHEAPALRNSQELWMRCFGVASFRASGVVDDLLSYATASAAFDEHPVVEDRAGPHEGDEVGGVHRPPAGLGGAMSL